MMRLQHKTLTVSLALVAIAAAARAATPAFELLDALAGSDEVAQARARQLLPRADVQLVVPRLVALLASDKENVRLVAYNVLADIANQVSVPGREADRSAVTAGLMMLVAPHQPTGLKEMGLRLLPLVVPDGAEVGPIAALLDDPGLQEKARVALVEMGTTEARSALRRQLPKAEPPFLCALLDGLAQLKDAAGLEAMAALSTSEHPAVRARAARALSWTGDPGRLAVVKEVISRADDATRAEAVDAWLRLVRAIEVKGGNWQAAVGEYQEMVRSADPKLRMAGLGGLGRIGDGTCVAPVLAAIRDEREPEWAAGMQALRQMRGVDVVREMVAAYSSASSKTQVEMLAVLAGKQHPLVLPVLKQAAGSDDPALRAEAIKALGDVCLPEAIDPLAAACRSGSAEDQAVARAALIELADSLKSAGQTDDAARAYLSVLASVPSDDKAARRRIVGGLTGCPSAEAFEVALKMAGDPELRDLAVPLLIGVGDKLAQAKQKDKALQLYRVAMELKPDAPTMRSLADKLLRLGSPVDWAAQLGIIRYWWVVGPFELGQQNAGWEKPYVDEPNVDLKGRYMAGKKRHEWKMVTADDERGVVNLLAALGPVNDAIGYACARIEVPAETDAVLRIGADDSERVWVNGRQVFELWAARPLRMDQDQIPVKLEAGSNTILMKIWQNNMGWEFCARLTTPDDKPVAFVQKPAGQ